MLFISIMIIRYGDQDHRSTHYCLYHYYLHRPHKVHIVKEVSHHQLNLLLGNYVQQINLLRSLDPLSCRLNVLPCCVLSWSLTDKLPKVWPYRPPFGKSGDVKPQDLTPYTSIKSKHATVMIVDVSVDDLGPCYYPLDYHQTTNALYQVNTIRLHMAPKINISKLHQVGLLEICLIFYHHLHNIL